MRGTIWNMATTERRPRIPAILAAQIDAIRDDVPFETYIRGVLKRHAQAARERPDTMEDYIASRDAERQFTHQDNEGAVFYVDRPTKGGRHDKPGVRALLVISDEDYGKAVGAYINEAGLRQLRDVCTELLGGYEKTS